MNNDEVSGSLESDKNGNVMKYLQNKASESMNDSQSCLRYSGVLLKIKWLSICHLLLNKI